MTPIKNIILDFGDVFINLDKAATKRHFEKHNLTNLDQKTLDKNDDYERGLLTTEEFIEFYTNKYQDLSKDQFIKAWNSMLLDLPDYRLDFIKQLKETNNYKLFLLSNTNDLHIQWVENNISTFETFKSYFNEVYLSHEINLRKPDVDIFEFVLDQNELNVEDTLFIDDTNEHIESANSLNLQTWHLQTGKEDVVDLFKQKHLNF
jgi:putative hydrolase of the HAD superfamily